MRIVITTPQLQLLLFLSNLARYRLRNSFLQISWEFLRFQFFFNQNQCLLRMIISHLLVVTTIPNFKFLAYLILDIYYPRASSHKKKKVLNVITSASEVLVRVSHFCLRKL